LYFVGNRRNAATTDFSSILPKSKEDKLKSSAAQSMGSEISDEDIILISDLCEQVRYKSSTNIITSIATFRVMVFHATFNNISANNRGGKFYWWKKPEYPEKIRRAANH
jgi:hypothetical protein